MSAVKPYDLGAVAEQMQRYKYATRHVSEAACGQMQRIRMEQRYKYATRQVKDFNRMAAKALGKEPK